MLSRAFVCYQETRQNFSLPLVKSPNSLSSGLVFVGSLPSLVSESQTEHYKEGHDVPAGLLLRVIIHKHNKSQQSVSLFSILQGVCVWL